MEELFHSLFDLSREAVLAFRGGRTVFWNPAAGQLLPGLTAGRAAEELLPPALFEHDADSFTAAGEVGGLPAQLLFTRMGELRLVTVYPAAPDSVSLSFLENMSASLRDSLAVLKTTWDFLRPYLETYRDPKISRYASMACHSGHLILRQAAAVSRLSELTLQRPGAGLATLDLAQLADELLMTVRLLLTGRQLTLRYEGEEHGVLVDGSAPLLEQLLLALLSNSIKNTPANGLITVSVRRGASGCLLTVRDNGSGMDAAARAEAFADPVSRAGAPAGKTGCGLGLLTVQRIARLHGGSAILESAPGRGTSVLVHFPPSTETVVRTDAVPYAGGMDPILTALADVLDCTAYEYEVE